MNEFKSRRSFFGKAAVVSGALAAVSRTAMAKSKKTPAVELLKIGVVASKKLLPSTYYLGSYHQSGRYGQMADTFHQNAHHTLLG